MEEKIVIELKCVDSIDFELTLNIVGPCWEQ